MEKEERKEKGWKEVSKLLAREILSVLIGWDEMTENPLLIDKLMYSNLLKNSVDM